MDDDRNFKEEILKNIRIFQEDLIKKINSKMIELNTDYKKFHQNLSQLSENNKKLIESIITKNVNFEKISSLENFRNKVDSILITHEIRINNNIEEISSIKTKYDKALIDNLLVPGYVGPSCQFKNIGEYIIHNINEISKIKSDKEVIRNSFRDLRIKTDSSMRAILNLSESSVRRCNDYTDNRISDLKKLVYEKIDFMNTKEREIKLMIKNFEEEQEKFKQNKVDFGNELKDNILSDIDIRINQIINKDQEEIKNKILNQNNNLEKYIEEIFENKMKSINENITEIHNKINQIYTKKENDSSLIKNILNNNEIIKMMPKFPLISSFSQRALPIFKSEKNVEKTAEKINNKNENNKNYKQNITYSSFNNNNNNNNIDNNKELLNDNYKPNKTQINNILTNNNNINNDINSINSRKKSVPDINEIYEKKKNINIENQLLSNKINQKNLLKYNFKEFENKYSEIQKNNNGAVEKSIESAPIIYKEKASSDLVLKHKNSKILIFNYEQKNHNTKSIPKTRLSIKSPKINDEFMKNFTNIKTLKVDKINRINIDINCDVPGSPGPGEEKTSRNIIDDLKNPKILEKRILSNEEIIKNNDKHHNFNNKINFSPQNKNSDFKTKENWKNSQKKMKTEKNINLKNKDGLGELNLIKLELNPANNLTNGAKVLANKKIMNNHITKLDYPNSFSSLYNLQIINKNPI
jgi:hypothetical protein